ncbi:MAG: hypothetical protein JW995_15075 [Melioribacteraceae bacterium]|nr:hypothetical protein [Melioribacteraceae bacterium]
MENILVKKKSLNTLLIDLSFFAVIYFLPAISHLVALPVYYLEPMRLMMLLAVVYTNRFNVYFIALTIPFFSFAVSAHPVLLKSVLISIELIINAYLFFILISVIKNYFSAALISIVVSKAVYYGLKFLVVTTGLLDSSVISTSLFIQAAAVILLSLVVFLLFRFRKSNLN